MEESSIFIQVIEGLSVIILLTTIAYFITRKLKSIPYPIVLLLFGILLSPFDLDVLNTLKLNPDLVLFIFLPILLFESAINFNYREFRKAFIPAIALSTIGILIAVAITGLIISTFTPISLLDSLIFGAIISSTDPIAVLSIFKRIGVPKQLELIIDGESFLNDATSIILVKILLAFTGVGLASLDTASITFSFGEFLVVLFGGGLVGVIFGFLVSQLISFIEDSVNIEVALTLIIPNLVFVIAEHYLHVSGIVAVLFAGLVLGNYGATKISPSVKHKMYETWEFLTFLVASIVFVLIGYEFTYSDLLDNIRYAVIIIPALYLARAISVYITGFITNRFIKDKIPFSWLHIINFGGLRGILPLVITLSLPLDYEYRQLFINFSLLSIYFTLILNGLSLQPLIELLKINRVNLEERIEKTLNELLIIKRLRQYLETLKDIKEIGVDVYNKNRKILDKNLAESRTTIKNWIEQSDDEYNYQSSINKVLRKYCLQVEKSEYKELFEKKIITEAIYKDLLFGAEKQMYNIENQTSQFSEPNSSGYKDVITTTATPWHKISRKLKSFFGLNENKVKTSYLYHKSRLLGNEKVILDLEQVDNKEKTIFGKTNIVDVMNDYEELLDKNQMILKIIEVKYPKITKEVDEYCYICETNTYTEKLKQEYFETGRLSSSKTANLIKI